MGRRELLTVLGIAVWSLHTGAQSLKEYRFSKVISASVDTEKVAWNLQEYAIRYARIANYKASLEVQNEFLAKTARARNAVLKPKIDSLYFLSFKSLPAVPAIAAEASKFQVVIRAVA